MKKASAFDVGTSPHGLPAGRRELVRKHAEGSGRAPSAKPVLNSLSVPAAAMVSEAQGGSGAALPSCASPGEFQGMRFMRYVPVAFAAKEWKVSPRRIRALLAAARLEGIQRENGYWEVAYPYRYQFGTRGPALKRAQKPEAKADQL